MQIAHRLYSLGALLVSTGFGSDAASRDFPDRGQLVNPDHYAPADVQDLPQPLLSGLNYLPDFDLDEGDCLGISDTSPGWPPRCDDALNEESGEAEEWETIATPLQRMEEGTEAAEEDSKLSVPYVGRVWDRMGPYGTQPAAHRGSKDGMATGDKIVCLEEMAASPGASFNTIEAKLIARLPHVPITQLFSFHARTLFHAGIPVQLHQQLLEQASAIPDHGRRSSNYSSMWMDLCIKPLLAKPGAEQNIVKRMRTVGPPRGRMRLAGDQLKQYLLLKVERLRLKKMRPRATPFPTLISLVKKYGQTATGAATASADGGAIARPKKRIRRSSIMTSGEPLLVTAIRTTTAPTFTVDYQIAQSRSPHRGLDRDMKRACLVILAKSPYKPRISVIHELGEDPKGPGGRMLATFHSNLLHSSRAPTCLNLYLIERKANAFKRSMLAEVISVCEGCLSAIRGGLQSTIERWIKYCISPSLADPDMAGKFCSTDPEQKDIARLSEQQTVALYTDLIASYDR